MQPVTRSLNNKVLFIVIEKKVVESIGLVEGCTPKIMMSPKKGKAFNCQQCPGKFDRKTKLIKHIERKHLNPINYQCSLCKKVYKRIDHFNQHKTACFTGEVEDEQIEMWKRR